MLFVIPGLTSTSQDGYVRDIVINAQENGYDSIVINYRGLAGAELMTPQLFCSDSYEDMLQPIKHYYKEYC